MFTKKIQLIKSIKIIRETLKRVGVDVEGDVVRPNIYVIKRGDNWFITHEKMLRLDNGDNICITKDDMLLENSVANFLKMWGMIDIEDHLIYDKALRINIIKHEDMNKYRVEYKLSLDYLQINKCV